MSRRAPSSGARDGGTHFGRALILLVVIVVVAVVLLKHTGTSTPTSAAAKQTTTSTTTTGGPTTTTTSTTVPALPPSQVKVLVLNGTLVGDLAGESSRVLASAAHGFVTLTPDNTTSKVTTSAVYAASSQYLPSAQAIAAIYGIPASEVSTPIPATAPIAASERALADVVLIIGPDVAPKVTAGA